MFKKIYFFNQNNYKDYVQVITNFIKKSLKLENILNSADFTLYDYDKELNKQKEYLLNKKVFISKFYANTIIKLILDDIKDILIKRIKVK